MQRLHQYEAGSLQQRASMLRLTCKQHKSFANPGIAALCRFSMVMYPVADLVCKYVPGKGRLSTPTALCYAELNKLPFDDAYKVLFWIKRFLATLEHCTRLAVPEKGMFMLSKDGTMLAQELEMLWTIMVRETSHWVATSLQCNTHFAI